MRKIFYFILVFFLGALATGFVDELLGTNAVFEELGFVPAVIHKVMYMIFGAVLIKLLD